MLRERVAHLRLLASSPLPVTAVVARARPHCRVRFVATRLHARGMHCRRTPTARERRRKRAVTGKSSGGREPRPAPIVSPTERNPSVRSVPLRAAQRPPSEPAPRPRAPGERRVQPGAAECPQEGALHPGGRGQEAVVVHLLLLHPPPFPPTWRSATTPRGTPGAAGGGGNHQASTNNTWHSFAGHFGSSVSTWLQVQERNAFPKSSHSAHTSDLLRK